MDVSQRSEERASRIAAAIGEPVRARMLYCLMDGRARTATELAIVGRVTAATASAHLGRLTAEHLVRVLAQGKHRYFSLAGGDVADVMEALSVLAGFTGDQVEPNTPSHLRSARSCYDHIAGELGVALHDRLFAVGWISKASAGDEYDVTTKGERALDGLGLSVPDLRRLRRRFAYGCVDWSERTPHLGGAVGAGLLNLAIKRRWVVRARDSRALIVTAVGRRELMARLGLNVSRISRSGPLA